MLSDNLPILCSTTSSWPFVKQHPIPPHRKDTSGRFESLNEVSLFSILNFFLTSDLPLGLFQGVHGLHSNQPIYFKFEDSYIQAALFASLIPEKCSGSILEEFQGVDRKKVFDELPLFGKTKDVWLPGFLEESFCPVVEKFLYSRVGRFSARQVFCFCILLLWAPVWVTPHLFG